MAMALYTLFKCYCRDPDSETQEPSTKVDNHGSVANIPTPGKKITKDQVIKLDSEVERTGVDPSVIIDMFKVNTYEELNETQYRAIMNKFAKTPDKAV